MMRSRVFGIYAVLIAINLGAWAAAFLVFWSHPVLLGTALLAFTFGLRHAVDADHICAIDNVTRKLMQEGRRPIGVGFFFSLGHSTVVVALTIAIAVAATLVKVHLPSLQQAGALAGTAVSAAFLLLIAAIAIVKATTTVEWPSEKKNPTPMGRRPSCINLRVTLSIAQM